MKTPPREVAGYAEAYAAGLLPRVPSTPPPLAVAPTARAAFRRLLVTTAMAFLTVLLLAKTLSSVGALAAIGLGGTLVLVLIHRQLARVGDRLIAEFRHGYATLDVSLGGFWFGEGYTGITGEAWSRWDLRGLWLLDASTGAMRRAPAGDGDPPGMYPSPHAPGRWELWTGVEWLGHFENPVSVRR
ncbi:hypothetical protein Q0Z83_025290 [Actinoplanes sichuanensis]|uniref:Uncharacterized protein n=1 Tax=Actinoplanes sichuanensis TaxID=512349 RepID=A0ABW4A0L4_9ACTN|nr:hypothetical protein [Actinoplanes sichuanensis]BEL04338.1 hypothetical protein Q0Z83_025290 [Actinoplanes sichuanensis]